MTWLRPALTLVLLSLASAPASAQCTAGGMAMTLTDSGGFMWDIYLNGEISNGSVDAYDGGFRLLVNTVAYTGAATSTTELMGRQVVLGPQTMSGLNITRKVYVPTTERWARFLDSFTNPGAMPVTVTVRYANNQGSDGGTTINGSSSGDAVFTTADRWVTTDDFSDGTGDPSCGVNWWGTGGAITPTMVGMLVHSCAGSEGPFVEYSLTVPAGRTVALMYFGHQNMTQAESRTNAMAIDLLPMATTLAGLTPAELSSVQNWRSMCDMMDRDGDGVSCTAGDCNDSDPMISPSLMELCNGFDDNCNAMIDEGFIMGGMCIVGVGRCQAMGTGSCAPDGLSVICSAMPGMPMTETCNGLDDDCDDVPDEEETGLCDGSPTGPTCRSVMPGTGFCGCGTDADCGMERSGVICSATTGRCVMGCGVGPGRNDCPLTRFCTTEMEGVDGMCTSTCNFDSQCVALDPMRPTCLRPTGGPSPMNRCVACTDDSGCSGDPTRPICEAGACVQCTAMRTENCTPETGGPICQPSGLCGCASDMDCPDGQFCHGTMRRCVPMVDAGPPEVDAGMTMGTDAGRRPPARGGRAAGCACEVPGQESTTPHFALALLAGLWLVTRRRRR